MATLVEPQVNLLAGQLNGFIMTGIMCNSMCMIAPDKAAYCVFTQFRGPENAIKLISVRTKTQ